MVTRLTSGAAGVRSQVGPTLEPMLTAVDGHAPVASSMASLYPPSWSGRLSPAPADTGEQWFREQETAAIHRSHVSSHFRARTVAAVTNGESAEEAIEEEKY